jgi:hypothetical protein
MRRELNNKFIATKHNQPSVMGTIFDEVMTAQKSGQPLTTIGHSIDPKSILLMGAVAIVAGFLIKKM